MIELTRSGKTPLVIENPVMPASGMFGYDGSAYQHMIDFTKIGAIVTNPITWKARRAANGPRVVPVPSGALLHTGLPNPGMMRVIKQYGPRWAHSYAPILVHVVATNPDEVARCAGALDQCDGVAGIELGLHDQASHRDVQLLLRALLDNTQLPVLVRVPLYNAAFLGEAAEDAGAGGLVVSAPPRGTARDLETGQLVGGRVYGAWLKMQALRAVGLVAQSVEIPVIGSGGIHSADDARDFIAAGAAAVQIDTLIWSQPRQLEIIARNLGGLELTRTTGALADEWQPGMGQTMWRKQHPVDNDDSSPTPPMTLPD
jgi:dihydroorotate dehydrogenase (NAD+) catalytic subunit